MIMITYREVELDEARAMHDLLLDLNRERIATRIKLTRLNKDRTRDLLAAMFDEEISPDFLESIFRETEGNPFFVEEVCKALIESGKITYAEGRWHRPSMHELEVPQSLRLAQDEYDNAFTGMLLIQAGYLALAQQAPPRAAESFHASLELWKLIGEPDDIAKAVEFLIAGAPYVTGQVIAVDGGRSVNLTA